MIGLLELGRRHVAERFEQAAPVVPRDPLQRRKLDVLQALPRPTPIAVLVKKSIGLSRLNFPHHLPHPIR